MEDVNLCKTSIEEEFKKIDFSTKTSYMVAKYKDNTWEIIADYQKDLKHASASMIKVLILQALVDSKFSYEDKIPVDPETSVEGGGALQEIREHLVLNTLSLASLMITLSDNTATNLLIDKLGFESINGKAEDLLLEDTVLQRKMMDFSAAKQGKENLMTVQDYFKLMANIYNSRFLPKYNKAWEILARQQFRDCLPGFWEEDIVFHHKTGELDGVVHDGGIIETPQGVYFIACFSSQSDNNFVTKYKMAKFGNKIYQLITKGKNL